MNLLSLVLVFIFSSYNLVECDDYRVILKDNSRIPIYTGLHYVIRNKKTGYLLPNYNTPSPRSLFPRVDKNEAHQWHKLHKTNYLSNVCANNYESRLCFSKIDDYYRIDESHEDKSALPLADGNCMGLDNGKHLLYRCTSGCPDSSDCIKWSFELFDGYRLYAKLDNFEFKEPLKDVLKRHLKKVSLMSEQVFINNSPATVAEEVSNTVTKTETFEVSHSTSITDAWKKFDKTTIKGEVSFEIFGVGLGGGADQETGFETTKERGQTNGRTTTTSKSKEYSIKKIITVPPHTSVKVMAYVQWIDDMNMDYTADLTVYGDGPSWENSGKLSPDSIRSLLQKNGANLKGNGITDRDGSLLFPERGTVKASMGLKSYINVKEIKSNKTLYSLPITADDIRVIDN